MKTVNVMVMIQMDVNPERVLADVVTGLDSLNGLLQRNQEDTFNAQIFTSDISESDIKSVTPEFEIDEPTIENVEIGNAFLILKDDHRDSILDLGSIELKHGERSFVVDVVQSYRNYDEETNETTIECEVETDIDVFDDCPYDLTVEDLLSDKLETSFYFTPCDEEEKEVVLVKSYLELTINNELKVINLEMDVDWNGNENED